MDYSQLKLYRVVVEVHAETEVLAVATSERDAEKEGILYSGTDMFTEEGDIFCRAREIDHPDQLTDEEKESCRFGEFLIQNDIDKSNIIEQCKKWAEDFRKKEVERKKEEFLVKHHHHFPFWHECYDPPEVQKDSASCITPAVAFAFGEEVKG